MFKRILNKLFKPKELIPVGWHNGRTFYFGAEQPGKGTKKADDWKPLYELDKL